MNVVVVNAAGETEQVFGKESVFVTKIDPETSRTAKRALSRTAARAPGEGKDSLEWHYAKVDVDVPVDVSFFVSGISLPGYSNAYLR